MLKGRFQRFNGKSFIVLIISVYRIRYSFGRLSFRRQKEKKTGNIHSKHAAKRSGSFTYHRKNVKWQVKLQ